MVRINLHFYNRLFPTNYHYNISHLFYYVIFHIWILTGRDGNDFNERNGKRSPEDNGSTVKSKSWYRSNKLLKPFELGKHTDEEGQKKSKILARLTILSSLVMSVEMAEQNLDKASIMKEVENYMPNTVLLTTFTITVIIHA